MGRPLECLGQDSERLGAKKRHFADSGDEPWHSIKAVSNNTFPNMMGCMHVWWGASIYSLTTISPISSNIRAHRKGPLSNTFPSQAACTVQDSDPGGAMNWSKEGKRARGFAHTSSSPSIQARKTRTKTSDHIPLFCSWKLDCNGSYHSLGWYQLQAVFVPCVPAATPHHAKRPA